jgi:hypothetical protein
MLQAEKESASKPLWQPPYDMLLRKIELLTTRIEELERRVKAMD